MREMILSLLRLIADASWAESIIKFIESDGVRLISENHGQYEVSELLAELKIRSRSMESANICVIGMVDLQKALAELEDDKPIKSYIFKGVGKTGIVYLDEGFERVIGGVVVRAE